MITTRIIIVEKKLLAKLGHEKIFMKQKYQKVTFLIAWIISYLLVNLTFLSVILHLAKHF